MTSTVHVWVNSVLCDSWRLLLSCCILGSNSSKICMCIRKV